MPKVRVLPDIIINKIAAGEVVERPSSIVKELVENSLDASSSRIFVDVEDGGKRLIKISDNGYGMEYEDALLAVERHATSKIVSDADLFSISTLGFRGEALPSIASVSRFSLETKTREASSGVLIQINGGKILNVEESGCAPGTIISARDLFFNTPARRKFLKTSATEMAHITEVLTCLALPWPSVHFRLSGDGRIVKNLPSVASPYERAVDILGRDMRNRLLYVEAENESVTLSGWISEPDVSRGSGQKIHVFVNGRYVRDRGIIHAICDAYRGSLMKGRFPVAVIFMDLPNGSVDVNVHPTKQEVRFTNQRHIYTSVRSACHEALMKREASRQGVRKAEGGFVSSFKAKKAFEPPIFRDYEERKSVSVTSVRETGSSFSGNKAGSKSLPDLDQKTDRPAPRLETEERRGFFRQESLSLPNEPVKEVFRFSEDTEPVSCDDTFSQAPSLEDSSPGFHDNAASIHESLTTDQDSPGIRVESRPSFFSSLKIIGQLRNSYILCESSSGLVIFDQHAAHERVVYERFKDMAEGEKGPSVQMLLVPEIIEFSPREALAVIDILPELVASGIDIEHFGENSFAVRAIPALLSEGIIRKILHDLAEKMLEFSGKKPCKEDIFGECFSVMACHAAIRSGQELAFSDMKNLINDLSKCSNPYHCPHGRPVHMVLSSDEMEKKFGRKG